MGITTECARCHDHRYDPVSQEEYYELFSFFNSVNEIGNIPYAGEASPTVILTSPKEDERLEEIKAALTELEPLLDPGHERYATAFQSWLPSHGDIVPRGMTAHYPMEAFVEQNEPAYARRSRSAR